MGDSGGLQSMASHRAGHDWSDLAASISQGSTWELELIGKYIKRFIERNFLCDFKGLLCKPQIFRSGCQKSRLYLFRGPSLARLLHLQPGRLPTPLNQFLGLHSCLTLLAYILALPAHLQEVILSLCFSSLFFSCQFYWSMIDIGYGLKHTA